MFTKEQIKEIEYKLSLLARKDTSFEQALELSKNDKVATSGEYKDLKNTPTQYTLPSATTTKLGGVKMGSNVADLTAEATLEQVIQEYNSLLEVLRIAGLISK